MNVNFKKILVLGVVLLAVAVTFIISKKGMEQSLHSDLPLPNEEEYTKQFNDFFKENYSEKFEESSQTAAKRKKTETFLLRAGELAIKDIQFHGKIVDQNGEPVSGVTIDYSGVRNILASGSGPDVVKSNESGEFFINGARGESLRFDKLSKSGYQFVNLMSFETLKKDNSNVEQSWATYTKGNPFIFKAWKIDRFPKVKIDYRYPLTLEPDGRVYTLTITGQKDKFSEGQSQGDIYLAFKRQGDDWQVDMTSVDGGFVEIDSKADDFALLAPESGYINKLVFSGSDLRAWPRKKLYFKSNSSKAYSVIDVKISPPIGEEEAVITIKYIINMEGGRSLVTPQRH